MTRKLRHVLRAQVVDDLLAGDFVRQVGCRGVGIVESTDNDHAVVAWDGERRDILPFSALRRAQEHPGRFDTRRRS